MVYVHHIRKPDSPSIRRTLSLSGKSVTGIWVYRQTVLLSLQNTRRKPASETRKYCDLAGIMLSWFAAALPFHFIYTFRFYYCIWHWCFLPHLVSGRPMIMRTDTTAEIPNKPRANKKCFIDTASCIRPYISFGLFKVVSARMSILNLS